MEKKVYAIIFHTKRWQLNPVANYIYNLWIYCIGITLFFLFLVILFGWGFCSVHSNTTLDAEFMYNYFKTHVSSISPMREREREREILLLLLLLFCFCFEKQKFSFQKNQYGPIPWIGNQASVLQFCLNYYERSQDHYLILFSYLVHLTFFLIELYLDTINKIDWLKQNQHHPTKYKFVWQVRANKFSYFQTNLRLK